MKINLTAELEGKDIADYLVARVKDTGIVLNEGTFKVKAFVHSDKQNKEIDIDLEKVRFVLTRE